jgi:hypothetical protein
MKAWQCLIISWIWSIPLGFSIILHFNFSPLETQLFGTGMGGLAFILTYKLLKEETSE